MAHLAGEGVVALHVGVGVLNLGHNAVVVPGRPEARRVVGPVQVVEHLRPRAEGRGEQGKGGGRVCGEDMPNRR